MQIRRDHFLTLFVCLVVVMVNVEVAIANVEILSHTGYKDPAGFYHVVGEVQNVWDQDVSIVEITATFYNSNNDLIATRTELTMLDILLIDRKSPFDIQLLDETLSENVDHYALGISFLSTNPIQEGIEILFHSSNIDDDGIRITGNVKNLENEVATNVKVIATFYNSTGNVIAAKHNYLDPIHNNLEPYQIREFEIILEDRLEYVDHYTLTAESTRYAEIPEFPNGMLLIISIVAFIVAMNIYKKIDNKK